ncbi:MAG TPA: cytochrome b/b6 domain-containing protein [Stellaceae bacterium]|nr:cytochrome b/b6 domain-containing protein [Stellaceae bacterium]
MSNGRRVIIVWDAPTRLFHWVVILLVAVEYTTWRLNWMGWHAYGGETLLGLLFFRLLWGFFGSDTARFSRFVASPGAAARYLASAFRREPDNQVGHNPAGGWMVLFLLGLLLAEALSGLYVANDVADVGPLTVFTPAPIADAITELHRFLWDALLVAVVVHIVAILVYALAKGHNLVKPMLTGKKSLPASTAQPRIVGAARALVCALVSGIAVAAIANLL